MSNNRRKPVRLEPILQLEEQFKDIDTSLNLAPPSVRISHLNPYRYMFPDLQNDSTNLLPEIKGKTVPWLIKLGRTMGDSGDAALDSSIPAVYTYVGQFIDHDITFEIPSKEIADIGDGDFSPLPLKDIENKIKNGRAPTIDLDHLYGYPAPCFGYKMALNRLSRSGGIRVAADPFNDLPRCPRSADQERDAQALIGDPRNEENLIIAQLHVAFLRAHNALVCREMDFDGARRLLQLHYQWLIIKDFLKQVAEPMIVDEVMAGNCWFNPSEDNLFVPLEFAVAAYRFGHSMVRSTYNYNANFKAATLRQLFENTARSGRIVPGNPSLQELWAIDWTRFVTVGGKNNAARRIDTLIADPLLHLPAQAGQPLTPSNLAVRNLLRGYLLRIPTGQAVARKLGLAELSHNRIMNAAGNDEQRAILAEPEFKDRTPLWYYILAEAADAETGRLGKVGSIIIAEVLIGLIRVTQDSFLKITGWQPTLGENNDFNITDLLKLAGVLGAEGE
jgi:hypothetical protein